MLLLFGFTYLQPPEQPLAPSSVSSYQRLYSPASKYIHVKQPLSHVQQQIQASEQRSAVAWPAHGANNFFFFLSRRASSKSSQLHTPLDTEIKLGGFDVRFTSPDLHVKLLSLQSKTMYPIKTNMYLAICKNMILQRAKCLSAILIFYTKWASDDKEDQDCMSSTFHSQINYQILLNSMSLTMGEKKGRWHKIVKNYTFIENNNGNCIYSCKK